ncbi:MAG: sn-glycerol-3-phosphate ABC transporter ATP-binding protein UgpC [Myxococcota bacterium]|jgi:multiple sugar transport system ATP-binding protein|nr:sn-glycerol-3-phosphate ABC transporter ATP-binding protein UgpC [Myxococcota bacterium]
MSEVVLKGVWKRYGEVAVVKDANLVIPDREFVVLVGPSGCGKSTTLRMIAGLEEISEGDLFIGEKRVNDLPPKERDIAMVFQSYALYPHMNVYDNLAFGLKLRGMPKAEIDRRVREAAAILGIEQYLDRKPKQLSGGQRQRVAMGRAIVREPKVFLFDEPLSNLDAKLRGQMRVELSRLHRRLQTTIVYVTHDQVEAMTLASRIVVMSDGVIQQVGGPTEVYQKPVNKFVAGFIGSPPMNFITVTVAGEQLRTEGLEVPLDAAWQRALGIGTAAPQQQVLLGVRPQQLELPGPDNAGPGYGTLSGKVEVVEQMGSEDIVYLQSGGREIVASLPGGSGLKPETAITLRLPLVHLHLFDVRTEGRLEV